MTRWKCINTWEKQNKGVICLSAAAQVALRGGGGTDDKQTEAMGRRGGGGGYLLSAEQICQPPVKHTIIMELHVLHSVFILILI